MILILHQVLSLFFSAHSSPSVESKNNVELIKSLLIISQRCLIEYDGDCLDPLVLVHPLVHIEVVQSLPSLQLGKVALDRIQLSTGRLVQVWARLYSYSGWFFYDVSHL